MIKYSRQRESILNALSDRTDHPTAETIYEEIRAEYPNISRGTVYRNLTLLADLGKVQKISTEDGPDRFDPNINPHCHFSCRECGRFIDIDADIQEEFIKNVQTKFAGKIEKYCINFSGLCPDCAARTES